MKAIKQIVLTVVSTRNRAIIPHELLILLKMTKTCAPLFTMLVLVFTIYKKTFTLM